MAAAFESDGEATLVERLRTAPGFRPEFALVAADDATVVGHVMLSPVELVTETGTRTILILAPVAVAPDRQGEGIGGLLVTTACRLAGEAGEPMVVLEGSPKYYPRFGFEPAHPLGIVMPLPDWAPQEAAQVFRLPGWDRTWTGTVVYSEAFDGLE